MRPQYNNRPINWKKRIGITVVKTFIALVLLLVILFLDALVIRGAYQGIKYVSSKVSNFFSEVISEQEARKEMDEETDTETKKDIAEILKEEQEELERIMGKQ